VLSLELIRAVCPARGRAILRSRRRRRISHCLENTQSEILRFAQNDSVEGFFRSLFSPAEIADPGPYWSRAPGNPAGAGLRRARGMGIIRRALERRG
ncbi:MAG: hypothetical protein ACLQVM_28040, partial [Terriglobia bacterium]